MNNGQATLLGLVQGLTEFLPVSSTAHLLVAEHLLGIDATDKGAVRWIEAVTHLGTIAAVVLYYRRDLAAMVRGIVSGGRDVDAAPTENPRRLALLLVAATAPLVFVKIARSAVPAIKAWRDDVGIAGLGLIGIGVFLIGTRFAKRRRGSGGTSGTSGASGAPEPNVVDAISMGFGQCVSAIVTGWSRSGSTIGTGLFCGLDAAWAARFSFLMSIPAILGGGLVEVHDMLKEEPPVLSPGMVPLAIACVVSFASGLAAIHALLTFVGRGRLHFFGPYCLALGIVVRMWMS